VKRKIKLGLVMLSGAIVLIAATAAGGYLWLRGSLPEVDGAVQATGLGAPIKIVRDRSGIPHIQAATTADALFGLGYTHAQDRLWQMEMNRRIGAGRMAEILGEQALATDKFLRTLGVYRAVEKALPEYDAEVRTALDAYAAGVNAFLDTRTGPLPPEFVILRHDPEPWRPEDSLVWLKMMAWDLGQNFREELTRARLAFRLSPIQIAEFLPPYPGDAPALIDNLPKLAGWYQDAGVTQLASALPEGPPAGIGSNNWVVDGSRTATGKPLLANDPHLGLSAPSVWYFAHL
jgi:penicillin amidase